MLALAAAAAIGLVLSSPSHATVTVSIQPEVTVVPVNTSFDVSIMIDGVDTISNFQTFIRFDPAILEFEDAYEGSLYVWTGVWDNTWFFFEEESLGTWEVFDVVFPAMSYVVPPGELTRIRFHSLSDGLTKIEVIEANVKDIQRYPIVPLELRRGYACVGSVTGTDQGTPKPGAWDLGRPYPNPTATGASLTLFAPLGAGDAHGRVAVYDCRGALVRELAARLSGAREVVWDGKDRRGKEVSPGVYFVRLEGSDRIVSRRVLVIR